MGSSMFRRDGLLIARFRERIPGFNQRRLSLTDLFEICEEQDYCVIETPLRELHGCSFYDDDGQPCMTLNVLLPEGEKTIAGWHEFAHLYDQAPTPSVFCSTGNLWNNRKNERQAQVIGLLALMPDVEVVGMTAADLVEQYGVSYKTAEQRITIQ